MADRWFDKDGNEVPEGTPGARAYRFVWKEAGIDPRTGKPFRVLSAEGDVMAACGQMNAWLNPPETP